MTSLKTLAAAIAVTASCMAASAPASAHGRWNRGPSVNFSFGYWGGPYWGGPGYWGPGYGYWGGPAVVYAPSPVVVAPEPRVYVESDPAPVATPPPVSSAAPSAPQWWYWCASARGYYPYVASCAEGWQRVTPQPSQGAR